MSESWRFLFLPGPCVLLPAEAKSAYVMWTWRVGGVLWVFPGLILWADKFRVSRRVQLLGCLALQWNLAL